MNSARDSTLASDKISQSRSANYNDLSTNGWTRIPTRKRDWKAKDIDLTDFPNVQTILQGLAYTPDMRTPQNKAGSKVAVEWKQDNDRYNAQKRKATDGVLVATFNTQGIIVVALATSPIQNARFEGNDKGLRDAAIEEQIAANMPELHRLSDVLFLEWLEQARRDKSDPRNIRDILWHNVETVRANDVIDLVLKSRGCKKAKAGGKARCEAPPWETHLTLEAGTEDIYAVLGTPNGALNAWFLLQHKEHLGHKRIGAIHITLDSDGEMGSMGLYDGPTLVFEIEDEDGDREPVGTGDSGAGSSRRPWQWHG